MRIQTISAIDFIINGIGKVVYILNAQSSRNLFQAVFCLCAIAEVSVLCSIVRQVQRIRWNIQCQIIAIFGADGARNGCIVSAANCPIHCECLRFSVRIQTQGEQIWFILCGSGQTAGAVSPFVIHNLEIFQIQKNRMIFQSSGDRATIGIFRTFRQNPADIQTADIEINANLLAIFSGIAFQQRRISIVWVCNAAATNRSGWVNIEGNSCRFCNGGVVPVVQSFLQVGLKFVFCHQIRCSEIVRDGRIFFHFFEQFLDNGFQFIALIGCFKGSIGEGCVCNV